MKRKKVKRTPTVPIKEVRLLVRSGRMWLEFPAYVSQLVLTYETTHIKHFRIEGYLK